MALFECTLWPNPVTRFGTELTTILQVGQFSLSPTRFDHDGKPPPEHASRTHRRLKDDLQNLADPLPSPGNRRGGGTLAEHVGLLNTSQRQSIENKRPESRFLQLGKRFVVQPLGFFTSANAMFNRKFRKEVQYAITEKKVPMSLIRLLSIGLLCFAPATMAEKSFNWTDKLPPVEVFAPVFNKVWAAVAEPEPFASLQGKPALKDQKRILVWEATLFLPGAEKTIHHALPGCSISRYAPATTYSCSATPKNESEADTAFKNLVNLVSRLRTDWTISQLPPRSYQQSVKSDIISSTVSSVTFTIKDQVKADDDLNALKFERAVVITRTEGETQGYKTRVVGISVSSGHVPAVIQSRFERLKNGNRSTPIPTPEITSSSSGSDSATLTFINNTQFPIELFLVGPTMTGKRIAPSATQDITVPPGNYSIVADFPESSNLMSFYGTQDYLPNFHYVYKLDTPTNTNGSSTNIDSEITKILSQGPVSALPTRQVSQSGTSGLPTLAITNSTQYSLRILASGPTPGDYTIMPGATQDITVSPGSYKIVGTVSASDVMPFYGTEDYASGTKYIYRFYIR